MEPLQFENKTQELLPAQKFLIRLTRYLLFSVLIIFISLGIGTLGYWYFGHILWIDAFYNASMILTGMGPVSEMTTVGAKLFSSFYALFSGIAFLSTVAIIFAPIGHRFLHMPHIQENGEK